MPDRLAAAIARDGFAISERHLDDATLERVRRRHADCLAIADRRDVRTSSSGGDTRTHLNPDFAGLQALHSDSLLGAVAKQVMNTPHALRYFLSRTLHPGASPQALHIDCDHRAPVLLGFIWMLDDFTAANGATRFVAGSHRGAPASSPTLAVAPAGSLVMYDRSVLHGYTANTSRADRRSIQGGFDPA
ncbi:MAG TPA: phytanoyl-CoA dioxygenase family protein [Hyphomonadaceae bacterium]|nr:phytanoyl-CoA dioxygenase family protein [Hyphomonadaceae bacterium]